MTESRDASDTAMQSSEPVAVGGTWFRTADGGHDYLYSREPGAISTRTTVWVDGVEHPVTVLTGSAVRVQLPPDTVRALTGNTPLSTMLRRVRVGRVRKDRSTPLEAAPDGMSIQGADDDAVLVWRLLPESERLAFSRIGPLAAPCRILREQLLCGVVHIAAADDSLPRAGWQQLNRLVAERRAFGVIVSSRQEEQEQADLRDAAPCDAGRMVFNMNIGGGQSIFAQASSRIGKVDAELRDKHTGEPAEDIAPLVVLALRRIGVSLPDAELVAYSKAVSRGDKYEFRLS